MPYVRTDWKNRPSTDTPINAERLNKIEECLFNLASETTHMFDFPQGGTFNATGVICKEGSTAQINLTFYSSQESANITEMPAGFHPAMNFDTPVLDIDRYTVVALLSYDRTTNMLSIKQSAVSPISNVAKASFTYVCDD